MESYNRATKEELEAVKDIHARSTPHTTHQTTSKSKARKTMEKKKLETTVQVKIPKFLTAAKSFKEVDAILEAEGVNGVKGSSEGEWMQLNIAMSTRDAKDYVSRHSIDLTPEEEEEVDMEVFDHVVQGTTVAVRLAHQEEELRGEVMGEQEMDAFINKVINDVTK